MTAQTNNSNQVGRPRRRADSSVKGRLNRWDDCDYVEFIPVGKRESNRTMLNKQGNSSFYRSEGEKESSYTVHINIDGSSEDPVNEAFEMFKHLTEGERKQKPFLLEGSQGRMLLDNGQLQVWLDTDNGELSILTRLQCTSQIERDLLQAQASMNVCLGRHRQEIINLNR